MNTPTIYEIAASLRSIRKQKGFTLREVEVRSSGVWKAVVIGSYERGDRALSLNKAVALAIFYDVPLDQLLGIPARVLAKRRDRLILDLRQISQMSSQNPEANFLARYAKEICQLRRDWNGEVLTLRGEDEISLSIHLNVAREHLFDHLAGSGSLFIERKMA